MRSLVLTEDKVPMTLHQRQMTRVGREGETKKNAGSQIGLSPPTESDTIPRTESKFHVVPQNPRYSSTDYSGFGVKVFPGLTRRLLPAHPTHGDPSTPSSVVLTVSDSITPLVSLFTSRSSI